MNNFLPTPMQHYHFGHLCSGLFSSTCWCVLCYFIPSLTERILFSFQEGRVAITRVANLLLCMYAKETVGFGMLKAKVRPLQTLVFTHFPSSLNCAASCVKCNTIIQQIQHNKWTSCFTINLGYFHFSVDVPHYELNEQLITEISCVYKK